MNSDNELSIKEIQKNLKNKIASESILVFDEIDSTNNEAKRRILNNKLDKTIIIANSQSAGRGRNGRSFFSPKDTGVYISIILNPDDICFDIGLITTLVCVTVSKAISKVSGITPKIKWVNDLYINAKKVSGILCEAVNDTKTGILKAVVVGIGINCNTEFDGELAQIAGALFKDNRNIRNKLIAEIINEIHDMIKNNIIDDYLEYSRENSMLIGREVYIVGEEDNVYVAYDIGKTGELILRDKNGLFRSINSGEVSVKLND